MTKILNQLLDKIKSKQASVGIIGLGYVGLPLCIRFGEEGFEIVGFDTDEEKVKKLNKGQSYIKQISAEMIKDLMNAKKFYATSDFSNLERIDCILICVPTPLSEKREPDMTYIKATTMQIKPKLRKGHFVCLESTTYPGTTQEILLPEFESKGLKAGKDFFLAYSPEREDPGNPIYTTKNIPKVVGGITSNCRKVAEALYSQIVDQVIEVSSTEVAEFTKLLENIFRAVNIALVNELKILASKMNIDIWEVIEASSTKPFGFMPFYPGPGLGGHCIPIDPFYLSWKAREHGFHTKFIELAGEINTEMPDYVTSKSADVLNQQGKSLSESKILILGVAYKKDTDDVRESPALAIIDILQKKKAKVFYHDPFVPKIPKTRKYDIHLSSTTLSENTLQEMDAILIITDHSPFDYEWIAENSPLIIDTRNATKNLKSNQHKVVKL